MTADPAFTELCKKLEHFETPEWAAREILKHEVLTNIVIDPCCGAGVLTKAANDAGYKCAPIDIYDWGFPDTMIYDFLSDNAGLDVLVKDNTVYMNPPFSIAVEFVKKCFERGARKVVCFQRFAWWESDTREEFWDKFPPNRIYICGDRADCWRYDLALIPAKDRVNPRTGKRMAGSPTAHAWFVWERGNPSGTLIGHIRKSGKITFQT